MKFVRFRDEAGWIRQAWDDGGTLRETEGDWFGSWQETGRTFRLDEVKLMAPLVPGSIIGIAYNYAPNGQVKPDRPEMPVFFLKPGSTVIGPEEPIHIPSVLEEVKFESELVAVIGKTAHNVDESEALEYVFGYTIGNDVTAQQLFHPSGPWLLGKCSDTFMPLGPAIVTDLQLEQVRVQSRLDGQLKQDAPLERMILDIAGQIAYLSRLMTLRPGDILLTGAPDGAGMMRRGSTLECSIEAIGRLNNPVR
ncbi:fumarylacetoacetate hydrolase family protein [Paenibacillus koleovorans]|uniref:fumarylacetoacetate hydrolase family protein n=1 Tax=Paenibacillus koleovorans TaxID=121608 RepID=UPI000FDBC93C|nr:fumarylacetoacetate hydrolase family protein [Paenibacillus koleovorans]